MSLDRDRQRLLGRILSNGFLLLALVISCSGAAAGAGEVAGELAITGRYRLTIDHAAVLGDTWRYYVETETMPGTFWHQELSFAAFGPIGDWELQGHFDSAADPADKFSFSLRRVGSELFAGSRLFQIAGPGLLKWERYLTGVSGTVRLGAHGEWRLSGMYGEPLGQPAHEEFYGKGITGPYLLDSLYPVVPGSDKLQVDGIDYQSGLDYRIDYELGTITFNEPVLETSLITVDYEYMSDLHRRTGIVWANRQAGNFSIDVLKGVEMALGEEDPPLVFHPPEEDEYASDWPAELPERQEMHGAAISWRLSPRTRMYTSWLEADGIAAWQVGAEWRDEKSLAVVNYQLLPLGFQMIGRLPEESGYGKITGGYEWHISDRWLSKLNVFIQKPLTDQVSYRERVEHVLAYSYGNMMLGWRLAMDGRSGLTGNERQYTTGALLYKEWGHWRLSAEHQDVVGRKGPAVGGQMQAKSKLAATMTGNGPHKLDVHWSREQRVPVAGQPNTVQDARLYWTKSSSAGNRGINWYFLWRDSLLSGPAYPASRTIFNRLQADSGFGLPHFTGSLTLERQRRTKDRQVENVLYNARTSWLYTPPGTVYEFYAGASRDGITGLEKQSYGLNAHIPLFSGWSYRPAFSRYMENDIADRSAASQVVQSLGWANDLWQVDFSYVTGILETPETDEDSDEEADGNDGDDEEEDTSSPLTSLPYGRRYAVNAQRVVGRSSFTATLSYERQREGQGEIGVWRGRLAGSAATGSLSLSGAYTAVCSLPADGPSWQHKGAISLSWQTAADSRLTVRGAKDIRKTSTISATDPSGAAGRPAGDYNGIALHVEWVKYF